MRDDLKQGNVSFAIGGELRHVVANLVTESQDPLLDELPHRGRHYDFRLREHQPQRLGVSADGNGIDLRAPECGALNQLAVPRDGDLSSRIPSASDMLFYEKIEPAKTFGVQSDFLGSRDGQ